MEIVDWPQKARRAHYRARELASVCNTNRRELERFFKHYVGQPPQQWLNDVRQHDVEEMLKTNMQLKEIAFLTGYKQPSHLTCQFKHAHGMAPSHWRKAHRVQPG